LEVSGTSQIQLNAPAASGIVVRGSIQVVDGDPKLENGFVQLKDANGHAYVAQYHGDSTDEKHPAGSFEFENVPSGPQVFEVSVLQPLDVLIRKIDAKGAKVTDATVVTDSGQELNLLVTAARISSAITGIVTKQGKPYAGAMILLMPENGKDWKRFVRRDQSDSDGTFRVATIVPGKYSLLALEHGWDIEWSKPEVLQPFLKKAQKLEIGERQFDPVILEVQ
jgi:hypothetical protein